MKHVILLNFIYIIKVMWDYDKRYLIGKSIQSILVGLITIINVLFPKLVIDNLTISIDWGKILFYVVSWGIIELLLVAFNKILDNYLSIKKDFLSNHFLFNVYEKMVNLDLELLENPETHDMKQKAVDVAANKIASKFCNDIFSLISSIEIIITVVLLISKIDKAVFAVLILVIFINIILFLLQQKNQYSFWNDIAPLNKESDYYFQLLCDPNHAKEMKMYSLSVWVMKKYKRVKEKFFTLAKEVYKKFAYIDIAQNSVGIIQRTYVYIYLGWRVIFANMTLGDFTLSFNAINAFSNSISSIIKIFINIIENSFYIDAYKRFMALENKIAVNNEDLHIVMDKNKDFSIMFDNVSFSYPGQSRYAIEKFNLKIQKGKFYVVVGENGAGKSTFVNLLCRLYDPQIGKITLNDVDIREYNYMDYRDLFSVVFQDYKYYQFTIAENIALDSYSDSKQVIDKINNAVDKSGLGGVVSRLKFGIHTYLGRIFTEEGIALSGGESQKLALARALYKDSSIFILDEPSSSLDARSEYELINSFKQVAKDKTVIYISHRLSIANFADQVIFIDKGSVADLGTHKELMQRNSMYKEMYDMQASNYKDVNSNVS